MATLKVHVIDGCRYKTLKDVEIHKELKANRSIKEFHLPQIKEKVKCSRYGSFKCEINGITFDSMMEGRYYAFLLEEKRLGKIKSLSRQVTYELQPAFKNFKGKKVLPINYVADFVVTDNNGNVTVVDVKGIKTPEFRLKEKLFFYRYPGIKFICIQWDDHEKCWRDLDDINKDLRKHKREKTKKEKEKKVVKVKKRRTYTKK